MINFFGGNFVPDLFYVTALHHGTATKCVPRNFAANFLGKRTFTGLQVYIELLKSSSYIFHMSPDTLAVAVGGCLLAGALGQVEGEHLGHLDVDLEQERLVPLTLHSDL